VMERTRRLSDETRELLSYATAEGEEFTSYVLGQLTSKKPLELLRELRKAESAGFVQSKKGMRQFANQTTSVFGFSHALFHKALYDSLLSEERVILHRQCYEILKTEWDRLSATQERTMPLASKLLTHAEKCGEIEIAAEIALETAKAAWIGFSKDETLTMLDATQRLLDSSDAGLPPASRTSMMGDIFLLRSKIMSISGRLPDALNMVSEAMKIFERTPNDKRYMETVVEMSRTLSKLGRIPEAEEFARKALATAETAGDDEGIAQGYSEIANVLNLLSRYDEALEYNERALDLLKRTNNQYRIAATLNNIGLGYSALGDAEKAMHYYKESLKISEPLGNRYLIGWSLGRIGREYHNIDENDKALEYIERGIKLQESIGNVSDVSYLLNTLGGVYESRGDLVKALECYKRHHDVGEYTGNPQHQAEGLNNMSQIYRAMNDLAHARECAAQAREIAKNVDSVYLEGYAIAQLGLIDEAEAELATGEERAAKLRGALAYMQEAADIYHKIKHHQAKFFDEELLRIRGKIGT
ncbi:MAG TPA: tetratricopeptide repeat protein, partial [Candidatus Kapabacteria bacterium]|nr:tetratricopeptide repeat protein [Candidatus Kapabacteria bacterium]